ncbi:MAG: polyphosphate kinase 2 family protein [Proteobacteria bacterium]|nr:polyphosphate kinase 2 family protein [Pseudomonadota bacterium]MCP4917802.1 polyphosphate kinase 2 family protein [Pseudomonadota bacterium]
MIEPVASPFRVPFDGTFTREDHATEPPSRDKKRDKKRLKRSIDEIRDLQDRLFASDRHAVLFVFQAMDAAGKDSTIRAVMSGVNPAGCQVFAFKRPSQKELDHDFLWRTSRCMPERGRIGIFNRSYYEELLVVRVHPSILENQRLPDVPETIWTDRERSIREHEAHLARNGTVIVKFFLNVSKEEQRNRLLARIDNPGKNWKFEAGDLKTRAHWDEYMAAYEQTLNATSRPNAPWYCIPADDKPFMRATVADIVMRTLQAIDPRYPELAPEELERLHEMRALLS